MYGILAYRSGTNGRCCIGAGRRYAFTHQMAALCCSKWRRSRHLITVTSNRKADSVNRCVFAWRTFLPNFIPIRFETTGP